MSAEQVHSPVGEPIVAEQVVDAEQVSSSLNLSVEGTSKLKQLRTSVGDLCDRAKSHEETELVCERSLILSKGSEHLSSAHGMANVRDLGLACLSDDVVDHSFVVLYHVCPVKIEEFLFILLRIE